MIPIVIIVAIIAAVWLGTAAYAAQRLRMNARQALLYAPFKLAFRIDDRAARNARTADAPVIYAVSHQSRLDPALMLSLLPSDTLHILDEESARAGWLEPWRSLARTIAFNTGHVFVSRRLVRHLKGNGRLAVYFPDAIEPSQKDFRLYRAVARIAVKSGARIVPVHVAGGRECFASLAPKATRGGRILPQLAVRALEPITLAQATVQAGAKRPTNALALFDRMMEARGTGTAPERGLLAAVVSAARRCGPKRVAFAAEGREISYRSLLMQTRMLARRIDALEEAGQTIGLMLGEPAAFAAALLAVHSAGRISVPIDGSLGGDAVEAQIRLAGVTHVIATRASCSNERIAAVTSKLEAEGISVIWLEDLMHRIGLGNTLSAQFLWRRPLRRSAPDQPVVVLPAFTAEGGLYSPVVSQSNLLAELAQLGARFGVTPADRLFSAYPPATHPGLIGLMFALVSTVPFSEPLAATVAIAPGSWFVAQAPRAADGSFAAMRAAIAGDWQVDEETLETWRNVSGVTILRAYASPAAGCIVALASNAHSREGTLGRFLPGVAVRLEGFADVGNGGRLLVGGDGVASAFVAEDRPGEIRPRASEWVDTGDLVSVNREGFVTRLGEADRYAEIGGQMVSLDAVEALAAGLWPSDRHVALTVTREGAQAAIVLATTNSRQAQRNSLRSAARKAGLDTAHVPAEIIKLDAMPEVENGDPDRAALMKLATGSTPRRRTAA